MLKCVVEMMKDDLEVMLLIKVFDVEVVQKEILFIVCCMVDNGEIMLGGGVDEFL